MALHQSTILTNNTVKLIQKFQSGEVKPVPTGIPHLDKVLMGGLLPGTILGIVARSQNGKSYDLERIQRYILKNEPDTVMMNGNYELNFFKILVRDICQRTGKTMDEVLFNAPSVEELRSLGAICNEHRNENIFYQNEPVTPEEFFKDVSTLIEAYPDKKIVVTVDNLENILDTKGSQKTSIDSFLTQINKLKDMHFFISFIILNQMNNDYILRLDNIKLQRPIESDIYGTGQLLKLCDVLYVKVLPWRLGVRDKFMVFGSHSYNWLEDFKCISDNGNTASFEPIGCAYYFYLKRRNAAIKDIQDVFAEKIFDKKEVEEILPTNGKNVKTISMPVFDVSVQPMTEALINAQGIGFEDSPF